MGRPNGKWGTGSVQTSATGATFVGLGNIECDEVVIINESGVALDVKAAGADNATAIKVSGAPQIPTSGNANEVQIRRNDQSNTQVAIGFIWRKY